MRVAIVTESFLPEVNGVTNSVLRVLEHLERRGHRALVIAPGPSRPHREVGPERYAGADVVRIRALPLPLYKSFAIGLPSPRMEAALEAFGPDVVHLASPIALGAHGAAVAARLGVPAVAVYQTDVAGFAARYHLAVTQRAIWAWLRRLHNSCARTLAPSSAALWDLRRNGVERLHLWARGVDHDAFDPRHRDEVLRRRLAPDGQVLVGYIGRLGAEKRVDLLAPISELPGVRLVVVGDGPSRSLLEQRMPRAAFLGFRRGAELSAAFASLDTFVHPGVDETFCQAAQEALASGVPVVAPAAGGLLDLVRHGETGLLCAPEDPTALVRAVASLAVDPARRTAMGAAASAAVAGRSWEAIGEQLMGHYRAVATPRDARKAVA